MYNRNRFLRCKPSPGQVGHQLREKKSTLNMALNMDLVEAEIKLVLRLNPGGEFVYHAMHIKKNPPNTNFQN